MKRLLLLSVISSILLAKTNGQTPVAYYTFDNNANDQIGTAHGSPNAVTLAPERRYTNINQLFRCYEFNGSTSYVNLGDNPVHKPTVAITISAWFRLDVASAGPNGGVLISNTECTQGYKIWWNRPANLITGQIGRNTNYAIISTSDAPYLVGWHHVALTYDGRYTKLYLNGELKATDDAGTTFPINYCSNVNTYVGTEAGLGNTVEPGYYWPGKIDEVKIFNTALTAEQVKTQSGFLPGSGKALQINTVASPQYYAYTNALNGINDFSTGQDFTIDFWFKAPVAQTNNTAFINSLVNNINGNQWNYDISIITPMIPADAGKIVVQRWDGSNNPYVYSTGVLNDNKWHHCAMVRSGGLSGTLALYIDGLLQGTTPDNTGSTTTSYYSKIAGAGAGGLGNFTGEIDELRFWNIGLTQNQLRDRMCKKIYTTDALWNNLTSYFRFDEEIITPGAGNETILNYSKNEGVYTHWQATTVPYTTSGAPIGTTASYDYGAIPSATHTIPSGESFTATATAGSPTGIHIYSVAEKPNNTTGAAGVGGNDRYFGVFVVGGTTPQYTAVYNYTGNPFITAGNEPQLILNQRNDNAATTWINSAATLNTTAKTLTATGQNTEYMLGLSTGVLPVTLLQFTANKQLNNVLLQWQTASEQNNAGFDVQHSTDGVQFTTIGFVSGVGNSTSISRYRFIHQQPLKGSNYYRLLQKDTDGRSTISKINLVSFDVNVSIHFYPNPVRDVLTVQLSEPVSHLSLVNVSGKVLWNKQNLHAGNYTIDMQAFPAGVLLFNVIDRQGSKTSYKIVRQ